MENQSQGNMTFKEKYKDFAILCGELAYVREYNRKTAALDGSRKQFLVLSEAMLTLLALERFLRILPAVKAKKSDSLKDLLQRTLNPEKPILICAGCDIDILIKEIVSVRNTLIHGNFEQAAIQSKLSSKDDYLKIALIPEVEVLYKILEMLTDQIDLDTGERLI